MTTDRTMRRSSARRTARFGAAVLIAAALAGCSESEERPLSYEPGVYGGAEDEELSAEAREALRERVARQGAL